MRALVMVVVLFGCSEPASRTPTTPAAPVSCDTLDRAQCLESKQCTLVQIKGSDYECRPEQGKCEVGHAQDDEKSCTARSGCRFDVAMCFCACKGYGRTKIEDRSGEDCKCGCGGGKPSMCVPASSPPPETDS
jgi:hypothetical protein